MRPQQNSSVLPYAVFDLPNLGQLIACNLYSRLHEVFCSLFLICKIRKSAERCCCLALFLEAFQDSKHSYLSPSQTKGTITLSYKGHGSRTDPGSYRPITRLNTDTELLAKVLADSWGTYLALVIDSTQTAFLPDRWIEDNVPP